MLPDRRNGHEHVQTAAKLFAAALTALGTKQATGSWQMVILAQDGAIHEPQPSLQFLSPSPAADADLAARIAKDLAWLRDVVLPKLLVKGFHGTATLLVVAGDRGLGLPSATIVQTLRRAA